MTQAAENLFAHALHMETLAGKIDREIVGQDAQLAGLLTLTVTSDILDLIILPKLNRFIETYPDIDLNLMATAGLIDLATREADIAVRLTANPPDYMIGREVIRLRHGIYGTSRTLGELTKPVKVILFRSETDCPKWVEQHFPNAKVVLRVDDVSSMAIAVRNHIGLAKMPCYIGDSDPLLRRFKAKLDASKWGIWVLSHVDLRATARVRVCREFLLGVIEKYRPLVEGELSRFI